MDRRWIERLAAFVAGGALSVPVAVVVSAGPAHQPAFRDTAAIRDELVESWVAWRRANLTYRETTRRTDGSARTEESVVVAQAFPRRTVVDGDLRSESVERDDAIESDVGELRARTGGARPSYRLSDLGGGCYRLRLVVSDPRPPWGTRTDWCFDRTSKLLRREDRTDGRLVITTTRAPKR